MTRLWLGLGAVLLLTGFATCQGGDPPPEANVVDEAWMFEALWGMRLPPRIEYRFLNHLMQPVPPNVTLRLYQHVRFVGESVNVTLPEPSVYRGRWTLRAQVEE